MKNRFYVVLALLLSTSLLAFAGALDGTWTAVNAAQGVPQTIVLQVSGTTLTGTAGGFPITDGKAEGEVVRFNSVRSGVTYAYKGTIAGNQLQLHETLSNGSNHRVLVFNHN